MDSRRPYLKNKQKRVYRECAGGRKTGFREERGGGHAQEEEQVQQLTAAAGLAGRCRQVQPLLHSALQVTAGDALHLPPPAGWGGVGWGACILQVVSLSSPDSGRGMVSWQPEAMETVRG